MTELKKQNSNLQLSQMKLENALNKMRFEKTEESPKRASIVQELPKPKAEITIQVSHADEESSQVSSKTRVAG